MTERAWLLALAAEHLRALISIGDDVQVRPNVQSRCDPRVIE